MIALQSQGVVSPGVAPSAAYFTTLHPYFRTHLRPWAPSASLEVGVRISAPSFLLGAAASSLFLSFDFKLRSVRSASFGVGSCIAALTFPAGVAASSPPRLIVHRPSRVLSASVEVGSCIAALSFLSGAAASSSSRLNLLAVGRTSGNRMMTDSRDPNCCPCGLHRGLSTSASPPLVFGTTAQRGVGHRRVVVVSVVRSAGFGPCSNYKPFLPVGVARLSWAVPFGCSLLIGVETSCK